MINIPNRLRSFVVLLFIFWACINTFKENNNFEVVIMVGTALIVNILNDIYFILVRKNKE